MLWALYRRGLSETFVSFEHFDHFHLRMTKMCSTIFVEKTSRNHPINLAKIIVVEFDQMS